MKANAGFEEEEVVNTRDSSVSNGHTNMPLFAANVTAKSHLFSRLHMNEKPSYSFFLSGKEITQHPDTSVFVQPAQTQEVTIMNNS